MKFIASMLVLAATLSASLVRAQDMNSVSDATEAANRWLAESDAGDAGATWDQAAGAFQSAVSKGAWENQLRTVRGPLGAMQARHVLSAQYTRSLPGAPEGEYVVIRYSTRFEHMANVIETVTPMREKDGSWKVSGYYVN
jgi:hypothetical protein